MRVSIITVVFNGAETLEACIKSVMIQTYRDVEHIIIDAGSTDGSLEIIKKYDKYIAYWISEPDHGMYDGMNKGIRIASGDVIGILNSDDVYADKYVIENIAETIKEGCCKAKKGIQSPIKTRCQLR